MAELSHRGWLFRLAVKCGVGAVALFILTGWPFGGGPGARLIEELTDRG
jgi:hypothetical protein